ncbi:MAG TPA: hypothetical protein IGS52_09805 [Oscillatoriaceae cyanobacterium M33_DOE_052]|uniref:Fervidolysin-like N-terminal prodomain domain-containing protein n=1 Tax=Planktothricoides sp. SpSt-374 TaxID=2282167 RepID=A0A7C3ZIR9_9CYAN|nr:hypothetical protein [Oscillatoriaceae cyanobacterium M33_DOE_052]
MPTDFRPDRLILKFKPSVNASEISSLQAAIGVTQVTKADQLGIDIWQILEGNVEPIITDYQGDTRFEYIEPDDDTPKTKNPEESLYMTNWLHFRSSTELCGSSFFDVCTAHIFGP